jgi:hypothetical protein
MTVGGTRAGGGPTIGIPAVFVAHRNALSSAPGGAQVCTHEYLRTLRAAGLTLSIKIAEHDRRVLTRIRHRLRPWPYSAQWHAGLVEEVIATAHAAHARFIFLNFVNLAPLAALLRPRVETKCKIVLLSHGLESVDCLHALRARARSKPQTRSARMERRVGQQLFEESVQRLHIDHVFCLTPVETEIERWLGAKSVSWLPRTIPDRAPLEWAPMSHRLGFVGTLDHRPNRDGLVQFLEALELIAPADFEVRVVGGPPSAGSRLAGRFRLLKYLGPLSDDELEKEASTWTCFVNPLFCYARGCSTKLAVALSWQIPVLTTPAGCRGYTWREGRLPLADTPESLAKLALRLADPAAAAPVQKQVEAIVRTAPTLDEVAALVRDSLSCGGTLPCG